MVREPEHRSEGIGVGVHVACDRQLASIAKDVGRVGAQQQGLAVWSLVTATGAPESDALKALAEFKSSYRSDTFDAGEYEKALKAAMP